MTCKLFDCPFQSIVLRNIASTSSRSVKLRALDVFRDWDKNVNIIGNTPFFVITFHFNYKSDFCIWWVLYDYVNWKEWLYSNI